MVLLISSVMQCREQTQQAQIQLHQPFKPFA